MSDSSEHDPSVLLHISTTSTWRAALATGHLVVPSLLAEGFIHLSSPAQVALPANRLYAGRDDLILLVIDPGRVGAEVRWEPGVPTDPASMRFPHLYGPLPAAAVTSVVPWRPGPDGRFSEPVGLPEPLDRVAHARAFDRSFVQRRAAATVPVTGGVAVLEPRFPSSWVHNSCWIDGGVDPDVIEADVEVLATAGCTHRRVLCDDEATAVALAGRGWAVDEERLMLFAPDSPTPAPTPATARVRAIAEGGMAELWRRSFRREIPDIGDDELDQLVRREPLADVVLRIVDLAIAAEDDPDQLLAGTQLRIDGASAVVEAVMTEPAARGRGLAGALVGDAVRRARDAGCDVVWLLAVADDWPRHWYARMGFVDIGPRWVARR